MAAEWGEDIWVEAVAVVVADIWEEVGSTISVEIEHASHSVRQYLSFTQELLTDARVIYQGGGGGMGGGGYGGGGGGGGYSGGHGYGGGFGGGGGDKVRFFSSIFKHCIDYTGLMN
jgi:hypothetical protein